jgi:four helix bundle protein
MRPHKRLDIWEEAMKLIEEIYKVTAKFPNDEKYGIISQMKRASISIASNIAEGCARRTNQEKTQFFIMARGSLSELDAQLEISLRLDFLTKEEYCKTEDRLERVSRMSQGLINSRKIAT